MTMAEMAERGKKISSSLRKRICTISEAEEVNSHSDIGPDVFEADKENQHSGCFASTVKDEVMKKAKRGVMLFNGAEILQNGI